MPIQDYGLLPQSSTGKKKKQQNAPRTEGGYLINEYRTGPSNTGTYRQSPRGNAPITKREFKRDAEESDYTYQGYKVPLYPGSEMIGLPAGTSSVQDGMVQGLWTLGNTQAELTKVLAYKSNRVRTIQEQLYRYGWIGKNSITGKATTESFQGAVAFLMQQGNMVGMNWQQLIPIGPGGLKDLGGPNAVGTRSTRGTPGAQYGVPSTSTSTSIDHVTRGDARAFLKEALANVLGRGPDPGEFNQFLDLLREKEKENPRVTTTSSVTNSATDSSQSSESSGGLNQADYTQIAERYAQRVDPKQAQRYKRAGYEQMLDQLIASE